MERIVRNPPQMEALLATLRGISLDKPVRVTWVRHRERRTLPQLRTYWWRLNALVSELEDVTGHTPEELHEALKAMFCPVKPLEVAGRKFAVRSTKALDVLEMADYMERCCAWAAETFGIELPEPIPANVREDA